MKRWVNGSSRRFRSGEVGLFIATPGSANLQPRIEGAEKVLKAAGDHDPHGRHGRGGSGRGIGDRSLLQEPHRREGHVRGRRRLDGKPRESDAEARPAGQRSTPAASTSPNRRRTCSKPAIIEFTIDQQPYLQGFVPALQLFFYKVSGTQTGPFEANTGLKFVTKDTVDPYLTKSRYEGTTSTVGVVK